MFANKKWANIDWQKTFYKKYCVVVHYFRLTAAQCLFKTYRLIDLSGAVAMLFLLSTGFKLVGYWGIWCGFALLVLWKCFLLFFLRLLQTHSYSWSVKVLVWCLFALFCPLSTILSSPRPPSQARDPFTSRRHADREHKLQREHQIRAGVARPG